MAINEMNIHNKTSIHGNITFVTYMVLLSDLHVYIHISQIQDSNKNSCTMYPNFFTHNQQLHKLLQKCI